MPRVYSNMAIYATRRKSRKPDSLSVIFGALSDPTRRAMLERLRTGVRSVNELAEPFGMSQPTISRHLKVLERAGLITRTRQATARLSHLRAEPLREATAWLADYREYWEASYERLDELLEALKETDADPEGSTP